MRISDWSSDVCSSDLLVALGPLTNVALALKLDPTLPGRIARLVVMGGAVTCRGNITPAAEFNVYFNPEAAHIVFEAFPRFDLADWEATVAHGLHHDCVVRSEEHTSELQSLMRISYAVFCLKKKKK